MSLITLGLAQIKVGEAAPDGVMPTDMKKIGKTYRDTAKLYKMPPMLPNISRRQIGS